MVCDLVASLLPRRTCKKLLVVVKGASRREEGNLLSLQVSSSNSVKKWKTPINALTFLAGSNSLASNSFLPTVEPHKSRDHNENIGF